MRIIHLTATLLALGFALVLSACGAPAPDGVDHVSGELKGGCRWDCPKCPANKICPMIACREICNANDKTCVQTAMCIQGYVWSSKSCSCVPGSAPAAGACSTDADCRTFADYCTGCDCRALSNSDPDPTCSGPGVRCFADPCMNYASVCVNGTCSLQ